MELVARVRQNANDFARPRYPERPVLGLSDAAIIELHQRRNDGKPMSKSDLDTLGVFGDWRYAVLMSEGVATGRLMVLLTCIRTLEEASQDSTKLREWVHQQYGQRLPKFIWEGNEQRKLAEAIACDLTLLPRWLRTCDPADAPKDIRQEVYQPQRRVNARKKLSAAEAYEKGEEK